MVFGDEHINVRGREAVSARVGRRQRRIDLEEAGDRLLLQPLARIARRDAGTARQFRRRHGFTGLQSGVQAELLPQIDAVELYA